MKLNHQILSLVTQKPIQVMDITERVSQFCKENSIQNGLVIVKSLHTTGGVRVNEKCDHLFRDLENFLTRLAPPKANYFHNHEAIDGRNNAHSHLLSFLMGSTEVIPVNSGDLKLGTWQSIFFVELDGPRRERQVSLTGIGT